MCAHSQTGLQINCTSSGINMSDVLGGYRFLARVLNIEIRDDY